MLKMGCFSGRIQNVTKSVGGTLGPDGKMRTGEADRNGSKPFRRSRNTTFSVLGLAEGICGQALQVFGVCDPGAFDCLKGRRLFGWFQRATNWNPKIQVLRSTLVNVAEHHETLPPPPSPQKNRRRFAVASPKVEDLRAKNASHGAGAGKPRACIKSEFTQLVHLVKFDHGTE